MENPLKNLHVPVFNFSTGTNGKSREEEAHTANGKAHEQVSKRTNAALDSLINSLQSQKIAHGN